MNQSPQPTDRPHDSDDHPAASAPAAILTPSQMPEEKSSQASQEEPLIKEGKPTSEEKASDEEKLQKAEREAKIKLEKLKTYLLYLVATLLYAGVMGPIFGLAINSIGYLVLETRGHTFFWDQLLESDHNSFMTLSALGGLYTSSILGVGFVFWLLYRHLAANPSGPRHNPVTTFETITVTLVALIAGVMIFPLFTSPSLLNGDKGGYLIANFEFNKYLDLLQTISTGTAICAAAMGGFITLLLVLNQEDKTPQTTAGLFHPPKKSKEVKAQAQQTPEAKEATHVQETPQ